MKIAHRVPTRPGDPAGDPVDAAYAAEVERHTARAEARYRRAQRAVEAVERRLARLQRHKATAGQIREATALVELRRAELAALHGVMQASPSSAAHRGTRSFRPLPRPGDPT